MLIIFSVPRDANIHVSQKVYFPAFLLGLLVTLGLSALILREQYAEMQSSKWPSTRAELKNMTLWRSNRDDLHAEYDYHYWVERKAYVGDRYSFVSDNHPMGSINAYENLVKKGWIKVYYNPDNPVEAVVEPSSGTVTGLLVSIPFMALFVILFAYGGWINRPWKDATTIDDKERKRRPS